MATLGGLERSVMSLLWDGAESLSANEVRDRLGEDLAVTTVLTVLSRLERKDMVRRERSTRPHRYTAVASREEHTVEMLNEVLGTAGDREAVLARFIGGIPDSEAAALRRLLQK
ncbi:BlaI/MecI/CopY family transcriptional regulator [Nesterenkonia sp. LB17]|uniref:BlaI/MecI/CopY family transcriptional regulator n=1 Tax=unclassified Nesterenkonia TaxID=2629769 RepID=UPI001F4CA639|nr:MULTISPECIES: BlaI/MecI/CopY family transcriptional regulator [unclassified Nesterenkonia]MCH8561279.1 BlaI/MecI/CopY family transcriptional regulator [Nesterenkonia sp. DZ6]MCH8562408.1 BlaI/MecI/CopY family transcriptional regulator [Nesterenkonia sp. YGD6]MCH8565343.1 BlaI/MecI/CopY family transcriptional regulator [Nesterenkonia sp. LB17]MCH8571261.1 BlaI/MecI/CopY family transcriptional regulator [Nesterenkonia sp. AY15]